MTRATCAEINLVALKHNLQVSRNAATGARQMAIIKANGYGHGLVEVARALRDADAFGVATVDEAVNLREAGIYHPIVLLEGFTQEAELILVHAYDLECVIHHESQVDMLEKTKYEKIKTWLKVDTGMNRLGFEPDETKKIYQRLQICQSVMGPVKLMTHLACADDLNDQFTEQQISRFNQTTSSIDCSETSIANSAGILGWPASRANWVRPGIMLYGVSPFIDGTAEQHKLKPVMTLKSELISIRQLKKGDKVGYGGTWSCPKGMMLGVVAIGYGDGYPCHARLDTPVLVNNQAASLVGRVSMDMITVDLSNCKSAKVGDPVTLWGEGLPVETIAQYADTIAYELLCGVTQRVNYSYN